jgi:hypothetical protein
MCSSSEIRGLEARGCFLRSSISTFPGLDFHSNSRRAFSTSSPDAQSRKHRRVIVVFSDCSNGSLEGAGTANPVIAGQASVLVIGFRGQNKDAVTQALRTDASNDVLIAPLGDAFKTDKQHHRRTASNPILF